MQNGHSIALFILKFCERPILNSSLSPFRDNKVNIIFLYSVHTHKYHDLDNLYIQYSICTTTINRAIWTGKHMVKNRCIQHPGYVHLPCHR